MWDNFDVRVSKKGRVCFEDFCLKIIKTSCNDDYLDFVESNQKYYINNELYITNYAAITILINVYNKAVVSFCARELEKLINQFGYNILLSKQKNHIFEDTKFIYFNIENIKWFKVIDICIYLKYSNTRDCVIKNISSANKLTFSSLKNMYHDKGIFILNKTFIDAKTIFINENGLTELLLKSEKPLSIPLAKHFGINVHQKFTRKEMDIVYELDLFCKAAGIKSNHVHSFCKTKHKYIIDYFIPDYDLAIEIDEFDHIDRDPNYEKYREKYLTKHLKCKFIRCNPDDPNFSISGLIGKIHKVIMDFCD
jgi:hypothetical protein